MPEFQNLQEILDFIKKAEAWGMSIPDTVLAKKAELEEHERINEDEFIFSTMKANNKFMSPEKEVCVRSMVDQLLIDSDTASQPCLLLGNVQCGKTDTFENIMGLAMDKGIDVCVVFTKGTNTLTAQTIKRLTEDFKYFADSNRYDQKVKVYIYDILELIKKGLTVNKIEDPKNRIIIVCKKEAKNLAHLIELFSVKAPSLQRKRVLIVDDEADFASRAYYQRKGEYSLLKIAEHIEDFINIPRYCRYLQVTATPYSLYLQPDGTIQLRDGKEASPWLPRYTELVPIHSKYIGGRQYYVESKDDSSMYSMLFQPVSQKCIDILGERNDSYLTRGGHSDNTSDLSSAIVSYFIGAAIRSIQEKAKNRAYKSSCLIHVEIAKKNHAWQEELIGSIIDDVKKAFLKEQNADLHILDLQLNAYDSYKTSNQLARNQGLINEKFPSWNEVESEVRRILQFNDYTVNVVNSEEPGKVATMLNAKGQLELTQTVNFFIGGSILDRGITIDNMLCFFYGRDPEKFQMDTVLQHARMYGARDKEDMACTRFYTTEKIYGILEKMNAFDDYLRDYLEKHKENIRTEDITSVVIGYDPKIKPSAQNKYRPANTHVIKPFQRILPYGFQTGTDAEIGETVKRIDSILHSIPEYKQDDYFLMDYEVAVDIIHKISSQFRYSAADDNLDMEWDPNEMLTVLDNLTYDTDGKIWCLHRVGRNAGRFSNGHGKWMDAPDDGHTDRPKEIAADRPALLLFREKGAIEQGWNGTPFYWPLLFTPETTKSGIFTVNGKKKFRTSGKPIRLPIIDTLPANEILNVTMTLGPYMDILLGLQTQESRIIKPTTACNYLDRDDHGNFIFADGVEPNASHTVYSIVNGRFPFKLKEYKYIHFRCSRDDSGSKMVVELNHRKPFELLAEPFTDEDIVYGRDKSSSVEVDENLAVWTVLYNIKKVLQYKMTEKDKETFEEYKQQKIEDGELEG